MSDDEKARYGVVALMDANRDGRLPKSLGVVDFAVLVVIAHYAGKNNRAWPAITTVADEAHCSPTAARRSIHRMVELGVLVWVAPATPRAGVTYSINLSPTPVPAPDLPASHPCTTDSPTPVPAPAQGCRRGSPGLSEREPRAVPATADQLREELTEEGREEGGERARAHETETPPQLILRLWGEIARDAYGSKPAMGGEHEKAYRKSAELLLAAYEGNVELAADAMQRCAGDRFKPTLHQIAKNPDGYCAKPAPGDKPVQPAGRRWDRYLLQPANPSTRQGTLEDFNDDIDDFDATGPFGAATPRRKLVVPAPPARREMTDEERVQAQARCDEVLRGINESRSKQTPPLAAGAEDIPW